MLKPGFEEVPWFFMVFSFLRKTDLDNFAVLDFGCDGVSSVIFESPKTAAEKKLMTVVGLGAETYPPGTISGGVIADATNFTETVRSSLKKASFGCGFNPQHVIIGLSGDFVKSVSAKVRIERGEKTGPISKSEWAGFSKKIEESLYLAASNEMAAVSGNIDCEVRLIEKNLMTIDAGGRRLNNPVGENAPQLTLDFLISFTQDSTLDLFRSVLKILGKKEIFKSAQIVNILGLLLSQEESLSGLFINLQGGATDVALVLGGSLLGVRTIPAGNSSFVRGLPKALSDQELDGDSSSAIKEWLSMMEMALADFEGVKAYPQTIVLYGPGKDDSEVKDFLQSFPWTKKFPFVDRPKVVLLDEIFDGSIFGDRTGKSKDFIPSVSLGRSYSEYVKNRG